MARSVIVSTARTPFGKLGGGLTAYKAPELGAIAIKAALEKVGLESGEVEYVIMGEVLQAGVGQAPARQAAIAAGLPKEVPADTINKVCASSIRAVEIAELMVAAGRHDVVVAGAVPAAEGAVRLPPGQRRCARPHGLRRAHLDLRRPAHGPAGVRGRPRARDQPGGAGRVGAPLPRAGGCRAR